MRRGIVLGVLIAVGAFAGLRAQPPANGPKVIDVDKVKDNLYVLKGGGGNIAVFVTSAGVTVVDAKNPGWGQPILDKIKELTPKPITMLINTHTHGDHVSGNVEFPATVDVVVQENTKANMEKMDIFKQNDNRGMAKRTFKDTMTIGTGADEIDLYYFGPGHTNGDAWVVFPALRTAHARGPVRAQGTAARRRRERRQRPALRRDPQQGLQRDQERRHGHQRPQRYDDHVGRCEGVRGLQPGVPVVGAGGAEVGQDAGGRRR